MTLKEVSSVIDDINEWQGQHGTVYYVTAMFTDESVGSVGRKDHDAALEVQGLLREAIGVEQDFTLEASGQTKTGRDKFKILGFGTPGGAATYTAPGVQGGGAGASVGPVGGAAARHRSPEHDQYIQERMDRRTALMQAVGREPYAPDHYDALVQADIFYAWLRKTSEPASSAYQQDVGVSPPMEQQAGVGSETTSPDAGSASTEAGQTAGDTSVGGRGDGEASCPPHDLDLDVAPKALRYPCRKCGFWVKPTMAAEEVSAE